MFHFHNQRNFSLMVHPGPVAFIMTLFVWTVQETGNCSDIPLAFRYDRLHRPYHRLSVPWDVVGDCAR